MRYLAYYPESEQIARFYQASGHGSPRDRLVPVGEVSAVAGPGDALVFLGRHGNSHDAELSHIAAARRICDLTQPSDLSLVCFDWHHDTDNQLGGTELNAGSWVSCGLERGLFGNAYLIGANPKNDSEVDPASGRPECESWFALRMFDRLFMFTAVGGNACLRYDSAYAPYLAANPSVAGYRVSADGSWVEVHYRTSREVDYRHLGPRAFVSIDLDVLAETEVRSDCPQGLWRTQDLLDAITAVRQCTEVLGWGICGAAVNEGPLDRRSLTTIATLVHGCTQGDA